jgi:hypothetical protein
MAIIRQLTFGKFNVQVRVKDFPQNTITRDSYVECELAANEYLAGLYPSTNTVEKLTTPYMNEIMIKRVIDQ